MKTQSLLLDALKFASTFSHTDKNRNINSVEIIKTDDNITFTGTNGNVLAQITFDLITLSTRDKQKDFEEITNGKYIVDLEFIKKYIKLKKIDNTIKFSPSENDLRSNFPDYNGLGLLNEKQHSSNGTLQNPYLASYLHKIFEGICNFVKEYQYTGNQEIYILPNLNESSPTMFKTSLSILCNKQDDTHIKVIIMPLNKEKE